MNPVVSVVMPVHNSEAHIAEAIESIQSQTFSDFELLVVFNGTTDSSRNIAAKYAAMDKRIKLLECPDIGAAAAMNHGVARAKAPWISRMDSDDIALPEKLERQMLFLSENQDVAALATHGDIVNTSGKRVASFSGKGPTTREDFQRQRLGLIYLLASSVVFSKEASDRIGGHRVDYHTSQDIEFWSRLADEHTILSIPETLVLYRIHGSSISMRRYFEQCRNARRAEFNMRLRRRGDSELTEQEYLDFEQRQSIITRTRFLLKDRSRYWYRRGASRLADGHVTGSGWIVLSLLTYPPAVVRKVKNQHVVSWMFRNIDHRSSSWSNV